MSTHPLFAMTFLLGLSVLATTGCSDDESDREAEDQSGDDDDDDRSRDDDDDGKKKRVRVGKACEAYVETMEEVGVSEHRLDGLTEECEAHLGDFKDAVSDEEWGDWADGFAECLERAETAREVARCVPEWDVKRDDIEEGEKREDEEGKAGAPDALMDPPKLDAIMDKAKGEPENLEEEEDIAGLAGAWDDFGADAGFNDNEAGMEGVEGPIGLNMGNVGDQAGAGGYSDRGGGGGGGGGGSSVDGVGQGTHGRGTGRAGYGQGSGGTGSVKKGTISAAGGQAIILGALDKSLIQKVIMANQAKFRYCYQRELAKNPSLQGTVTLNFTISGTGSVAKSSTYKTTLNSPNAETCFNQQMKMLKFPEPKGGGIVIVKYPFTFGT